MESVLLQMPWAHGNEHLPPYHPLPPPPMHIHQLPPRCGVRGMNRQREGACSWGTPLCLLYLPLPWHSRAIGEVLHEWAQAGEGEDRQDGKGQLKGEQGEGGTTAGLGCWGAGSAPHLTRMLWRTLRMSFMPVRCLTSLKAATKTVGRMAKERVKSTRAKRDQRSCRKPWGHGKTCTLAPCCALCRPPPHPGLDEHRGHHPLLCVRALGRSLQGCQTPLDVSSSS